MKDRGFEISDSVALELWRRAAELQARAEEAAPSRRSLPVADGSGLSLDQVIAAAEGAGINGEYVRIARAEQRLPDSRKVRADDWTLPFLKRLLKAPDAIEVTRLVDANASRVFEALQRVISRPPFCLALEDSVGEHPLQDGVFVYRLAGRPLSSSFNWNMERADVRVVIATVRPEGGSAWLHLRAPLFRRGMNLALSGASAGLLGAGGYWGGAAVAAFLSVMAGALTVGAGAAAGSVLGIAGYRRLYQGAVRKAEAALGVLASSVAVEAKAGPTGGP